MGDVRRETRDMNIVCLPDDNLGSLNFQLQNPAMKRIINILNITQSSYVRQFIILSEEIEYRIEQARSNIEFLQILLKPSEELEKLRSPENVISHLPKIMNLCRVIWLNSSYLKTKEKMANLFRSLNNEIILKCKQSINFEELFEGKARKTIKDLNVCISCCQACRSLYYTVGYSTFDKIVANRMPKRKIILKLDFAFCCNNEMYASFITQMSEAHNELTSEEWKLDDEYIFCHVDTFITRCNDCLEICQAMIDFAR